MKTKYHQRIANVLCYIEANLDQKLTLERVAAQSYFSEYHFHRIFRGIMDETLNDYIVRRRLERAVNSLAFQPAMSITDIALSHGFSSSANFAKAVKNFFGFSPSDIRKPAKATNSKIGKIHSQYGKVFNPEDLYPYRHSSETPPLNKGKPMNVDIKKLPEQTLCVQSSKAGYQPDALFETWDNLIHWGLARGIDKSRQQRFAICYDNPAVTPVEKCRYEAALVVDNKETITPPFIRSTLPAGQYAVLYVKGDQADVSNAQLGLYSHWLPESGFEPDGFPMVERYLNDVREAGYLELEIYIKLKALT